MANRLIKPPLPVINQASPFAKRLVGCWSFFERGGTILHDISEKNNHGVLTGMDPATDWVKTPRGYALDFDGVDDYVEVSDSPTLNIINQITIEAWIKPKSFPTYSNIIEKDQTGGYKLGLHNDNVVFTLYTIWDALSTGKVLVNEWSHVAATYNRSVVRIYINGRLDTSISHNDQIGTGTSPVNIGRRRSNATAYFPGLIDEVQIWNRILNPREIATLYANPNILYCCPKRFDRYAKYGVETPSQNFMRGMKYW